MKAKLFIFVLSTIYLLSCKGKSTLKQAKTFNFTTYEISYFDGWSRFSFAVDTSKVYLAAFKADTLEYGILPDSIFEIVNKNAFLIFKDKSITSKSVECWDCPEISILATFLSDTVKIVQKGSVSDKVFFPVLIAIHKFNEKSRSNGKYNPFPQMLFETVKPLLSIEQIQKRK